MLQLIEDTIDWDLRCYRPSLWAIQARFVQRCRRAGWRLDQGDRWEIERVIRAYSAGLRARQRPQFIFGLGRTTGRGPALGTPALAIVPLCAQ
jgi:hypothetical protein